MRKFTSILICIVAFLCCVTDYLRKSNGKHRRLAAIFPAMPLAIKIEITRVACRSDRGPFGNDVSSFCNSTKLMAAHPVAVPTDAVKKNF